MTEQNFFGMMTWQQNMFWILVFFVVVIIAIIWHLRLRKSEQAQANKNSK
jgi:hypothetical protein